MGNCVTINTNNRGVVAPMDPQGGGNGTTISNNICLLYTSDAADE